MKQEKQDKKRIELLKKVTLEDLQEFTALKDEKVAVSLYDFEIKTTADLVKANNLQAGKKIRFVNKLPLSRLLYRQDIREFVSTWNEKFQEKTVNTATSINIEKILEDKILLAQTELLLETQEVEFISCQETRDIEKANEKLADTKATIRSLRQEVKDAERKASIIRREKLLNDLKSSIGYKY